MKISIVTFSPSGHTGKVASILKDVLEQRHHQVEHLEMARRQIIDRPKALQTYLADNLGDPDLLMVGGPVYVGHLQAKVLQVIKALPRPNRWTGKVAVPFVTWGGRTTGVALNEAAQALRETGRFNVMGLKFLSFHTMSKAFQKPINAGLPGDMARNVAEEFADRLQDIDLELPQDVSDRLDYQGFRPKLESVVLSEALFQSKFMPNISILVDKCTRCKTCVKRCPVQIIDLVGNGPPSRSNRGTGCIHCGECYFKCPEGAVVYDATKFESHVSKAAVHTPSGEVERPGNTCVIA